MTPMVFLDWDLWIWVTIVACTVLAGPGFGMAYRSWIAVREGPPRLAFLRLAQDEGP